MVCPYCGSDTQVTNSRRQKKANQVWRRRVCKTCGAIFTTLEGIDTSQALMYTHHKHSEPFSRDTLLLSIYDSLKHRKTATKDATALTATVMSHLYPLIHDASLSRDTVTEVTAATLERFDPIAATHYRAFHPA